MKSPVTISRLAGLTLFCAATAFSQVPDLARLKLAAEAGDPIAEYNYGESILSSNSSDSTLWLRRSAEMGYAPAQEAMAKYYERNLTINKAIAKVSKRKGAYWVSKAAFQGYAPSEERLGIYYRDGYGVISNPIIAYMWLRVAATNPNSDAGYRMLIKSTLDQMIANMTSADIREGERRAQLFTLPQNEKINSVEADLIFSSLKLSAIIEVQGKLNALVNDTRFASGDSKTIRIDDEAVGISCVYVDSNSVYIALPGSDYHTILKLNP